MAQNSDSPSDQTMIVAIGLGAVGGIWAASTVMKELFVHGLTDKERYGIYTMAASAMTMFAAKYFFDIDEQTIDAKIAETFGFEDK